jgi:diacylglycerol kinase (ATP)
VRVAVIINPISGTGGRLDVARARAERAAARLTARGVDCEVCLSERPGHARDLAEAALRRGAGIVAAWGGDGTVNEVASQLAYHDATLAIVPSGSGNGLSRELRIPFAAADAFDVALVAGRDVVIDAGELDDHLFFNIAGIGVDARIARLFNERSKGSRGRWPYVAIGMREGCRYRSDLYEIELDGEPCRVRALLVAFANGREYGMGARLAPDARLDDGLLDARVVEDRSLAARFWHARHVLTGRVERAPRILSRRVRHAVVRGAGPLEYHVDGEPGMAGGQVEVTIRPHALLVKGWR